MGQGHSYSKGKGISRTQRNEKQASDGRQFDDRLQSGTREFPKVHYNGSISSVDCITNGQSLCLSAGSEGRIAVFDVNSTKLVKRWQAHEKEISKVIHAGTEPVVFSSSRDKLIKMWSSRESEPVQVLKGHSLGVSSITCNKDGTFLVSGSRDNSVRLWDTAIGTCVKQSSIPRNMVTSVEWIEEANLVVQTGEDKIMKLWDTRSLTVARNFPMKQYFQTASSVSSDGLRILTGSTGFNANGCEVALWDVREGRLLREYKGHSQKVSDCCFLNTPHGNQGEPLLMSVSADCSVKIWSQESSDCVMSEVVPAAKELTSVSSFDDGRVLVGTYEYGIHLCKLSQEGHKINIHPLLRF
eukprot:gene16230-17867_t